MASRKARERRRLAKVALMEELHYARDLGRLTKSQLIEYAEENGIKVDKTAKKAEIYAKIKE
jgi:hypothetical protein